MSTSRSRPESIGGDRFAVTITLVARVHLTLTPRILLCEDSEALSRPPNSHLFNLCISRSRLHKLHPLGRRTTTVAPTFSWNLIFPLEPRVLPTVSTNPTSPTTISTSSRGQKADSRIVILSSNAKTAGTDPATAGCSLHGEDPHSHRLDRRYRGNLDVYPQAASYLSRLLGLFPISFSGFWLWRCGGCRTGTLTLTDPLSLRRFQRYALRVAIFVVRFFYPLSQVAVFPIPIPDYDNFEVLSPFPDSSPLQLLCFRIPCP